MGKHTYAWKDKGNTHQWLRSAGLKAEIESFIMAAQDQNLFTKNYLAKIIKNGADPKCRFCDKFEETVDHLLSGCPIMTSNEYLQRHDRVGQYTHWKIFSTIMYHMLRTSTNISHRKL